MIASWWAAIAMLTRLPASRATNAGTGSRWFGLVGGLVGLGAFVPLAVLGAAFPSGAAILAVGSIAVLSGCLHLDGLADTADALVAFGPGAAERARKDPSIGVAGATALILVLGLEVASLATLAGSRGAVVAGLACLAGGAASRAVPGLVARLASSRAAGAGLGETFARQVSAIDAAVAMTTALAVAAVAAWAAGSALVLAVCVTGIAAGVALGLGTRRRADTNGYRLARRPAADRHRPGHGCAGRTGRLARAWRGSAGPRSRSALRAGGSRMLRFRRDAPTTERSTPGHSRASPDPGGPPAGARALPRRMRQLHQHRNAGANRRTIVGGIGPGERARDGVGRAVRHAIDRVVRA